MATETRADSVPGHQCDSRTIVRQTVHWLNSIADTGASANTVSNTWTLAGNLKGLSQPSARRLYGLLKAILAFSHTPVDTRAAGTSAATLPAFAGVPTDLVDRAAAACYERRSRRPDEILLSFAGDCTFGAVNGDSGGNRFPAVYRDSGETDYPFALVRPWFVNDDLTVVNFECTLTDAVKAADKQWHFKGPAKYASIFPAGSVEAVGLSNNHSFDYLQSGFDDTVANFGKANVPVFYRGVPYITTIKGTQVVIIGDVTVVGENTTQLDGVPERVLSEIKRYKRPNNLVIVVMHWGSELDRIPRPWQQALGREFIDAGADAVVGHHPHVVQGIELYKGKYIAYSLGNFAFGGNSLARNPDTFILRLRFRVGHGPTSVLPISIAPCWITSSRQRNKAGILINDYQPTPVFGVFADQTVALVLKRSATLKYGLKKIDYLRLR